MSLETLCSHFRRRHQFEHALAFLGWDEAAMMPEGGAAARAASIAQLRQLIHELACDERILGWIDVARRDLERIDDRETQAWHRANLALIERIHRRSLAIPPALVERISLASSRCETSWRKLRPANDWAAFAPLLRSVVDAQREAARHLSEALGMSPYDAMIDEYEPGLSEKDILPLFAQLESTWPQLLERARACAESRTPTRLEGHFPIPCQQKLGETLMRAAGFDFDRGRLDTSTHPFCGGVSGDVRITTRYDTQDPLTTLMGVLHETGHAKYEQHLPTAWHDQPVGAAASMSIHESQSLLQEMAVCRGKAYVQFLSARMREAFPEQYERQPKAFDPENLYRLQTRVKPGKIRVDADEVSYPGHILLRFEIERRLFSGDLDVAEIPELWNEKMETLFDVRTVGDFKDGCMQDVHWPSGAFGYFPSYTMGAMFAAQLLAAARKEIPDLERDLARGDQRKLDAWLDRHIWSRASRCGTLELIAEATGKAASADDYLAHLEARYIDEASATDHR